MKRYGFGSVVVSVVVSLTAVGCGGDDDDDAVSLSDAASPDAPAPPDAAPDFDAQLFDFEPGLGVDNLDLVGRNPLFATLGTGFVNAQIDTMIGSGGLTLAIGIGDLDDPSGQTDAEIRVGLYSALDPDGDPSNNFDETAPDSWIVTPDNFDAMGEPTIAFEGSIEAGRIQATSDDAFNLPGLPVPFPITSPTLDGVLVPNGDSTAIDFLESGDIAKETVTARLTGAILTSTLGGTPNLAAMAGCQGANLLDVLVVGCAAFGLAVGVQPDLDQDGDGLESLCDECSDPACADAPTGSVGPMPDAGMTGDGEISCCVDGNRTTVELGVNCWNDVKFADGYAMELDLHGTRVLLQTETSMD